VGNGYLVGIHQGIWETQAVIINTEGAIVCTTSKSHKQFYPKPDWVEQDAVEIYGSFKGVLNNIIFYSGISGEEFDVLAIANQRDTVLVWDKNTGEPVYRAIVSQCKRTVNYCEELKNRGYDNTIRDKTGLTLDPSFSASKIRWILDNVEGAREKAEAGELLAGNIDSWLIWKLTGGKVHATDYTNASRTLLFNINTFKWDEELLKMFDIPKNMLPEIKYSDCIFGFTNPMELFSEPIPIAGVIGDAQGALFGKQCFDKGMARAVYGMDTYILMNIGDKYIKSKNKLVTTVAWALRGSIEYAVEGVVEHTGDALKWIIEEPELLRDYSDIDTMTSSIKDNGGVYLVPTFLGKVISCGYECGKAIIVDMNKNISENHIVRAAVETMAYQVKGAIDAIEVETGIKLKELWVEGHMTSSRFFMQFQADMLNCIVARSNEEELAAMGAIYLAGLYIGVWKSKDELKKLKFVEGMYKPSMEKNLRDNYLNGWKAVFDKVINKRS
jgi:glycerol kinase